MVGSPNVRRDRLRASPAAETIRAAVLADQANGRAEALAKIAAAKAPKRPLRPLSPPQSPRQCRKPASAPRKGGKRAEMLASAQSGVQPARPDFTAETHKRFRGKLDEVIALVEAGDVAGLRAYLYTGFLSSSPKAIMRYRDLALAALEARGKGGGLNNASSAGCRRTLPRTRKKDAFYTIRALAPRLDSDVLLEMP